MLILPALCNNSSTRNSSPPLLVWKKATLFFSTIIPEWGRAKIVPLQDLPDYKLYLNKSQSMFLEMRLMILVPKLYTDSKSRPILSHYYLLPQQAQSSDNCKPGKRAPASAWSCIFYMALDWEHLLKHKLFPLSQPILFMDIEKRYWMSWVEHGSTVSIFGWWFA